MQVITFEIEEEVYGVDIVTIDEIIPAVKITPVPQAPDFIEGVINLRGAIIPVIDLKKQFGHKREYYTTTNRIIIVNLERRAVGFVVDNISDVKVLEEDEIHPPVVHPESAELVHGVAKLEEGKVTQLINMSKLLKKDQLEQLALSA